MYIKWAGCPHCGKTIRVTVEPGGPVNFRLGEPKIITCPRCGRQFTDGSREWEQMDALGKSREALLAAFGGLFIAPLIGAVVGAGLGVLIGSENLWFPGTCAALASAAYFYGFRSMILASKDRTSADAHIQRDETMRTVWFGTMPQTSASTVKSSRRATVSP